MLELIKKHFTTQRIGVDISNNVVKAVESNRGIYVDKSIGEIISNKYTVESTDCWQDTENILKVIKYCMAKLGRLLLRPEIVLSIPAELSEDDKDKIKEILLHNAQTIYFIQSVIAAAIGASTDEIRIMGDTLTKKFYIFSDKTQTYVSLIWAGGLVDFRKINKGYKSIEIEDLFKEITDIKLHLPEDVPQKFLSDIIDTYKHTWYEPIEKKIYVSVPMETRYWMGRYYEDYNLTYTDYNENLIITGITPILSDLPYMVKKWY